MGINRKFKVNNLFVYSFIRLFVRYCIKNMIFETERFFIRKLKPTDIAPFHKMNANKKVMMYTDSSIKTYDDDVLDLADLISKYDKPNNRFWVWAVIRKKDDTFLGSVALIDYDTTNDEVGFRFLEKYWNNGYGFEAMEGLLKYAKAENYKTLIGEVYAKNIASEKILKKLGFTLQKEDICERTGFLDRLYKINL